MRRETFKRERGKKKKNVWRKSYRNNTAKWRSLRGIKKRGGGKGASTEKRKKRNKEPKKKEEGKL